MFAMSISTLNTEDPFLKQEEQRLRLLRGIQKQLRSFYRVFPAKSALLFLEKPSVLISCHSSLEFPTP